MVTILTIAGSDPSGGAGVQADLRTFETLGAKGLSAITAITAQTEEEFTSIHPTPADVLTQQISAVTRDVEINAIKIGMIATAANVQAVTWFLKRMKDIPIVVDPIIDSSTGYSLLEPAALPLFEQHLLPLSTVVTPNLDEARTLAKMQVKDIETMHTAAKIIHENCIRLRGGGGRLAIIITGGHLKCGSTDIIYDGEQFIRIDGESINSTLHGSGCIYSSALAAYLAQGANIRTAAKKAKSFVENELRKKLGK